ncbi:immunoglobulin domain-containing protein [Chitinophaga japonensis]|uniref:Ig-like domain-containing protein n=1 Tax=Chitinophaga japonensis TaxID=104662 RepID=A0A562STB4_CHIJA|nr:hypothetical protein [Chitinophaga japonensis]TWI84517.1 hypothetical protein LX66_4887 [Chitinophaga japonensis]
MLWKIPFNRSSARGTALLLSAIACPFFAIAQGPQAYALARTHLASIDARLAITYEQVSICRGDSATLNATTNMPFPVTLWYDAPQGGNLLHTGSAFTVSPEFTTVYYAATELYGEDIPRDSITVTVSNCQRRQAIGAPAGFVNVPPRAVKLHLSANTASGELLLEGQEQWAGSSLSVKDAKGRELQHELLEGRRFRLSSRCTDGLYIVSVTTPEGKVLIGKVRLYQ